MLHIVCCSPSHFHSYSEAQGLTRCLQCMSMLIVNVRQLRLRYTASTLLSNSLPGANRPMGPWPIRSLRCLLPGSFTSWPIRSSALSLSGPLVPWNFRSIEHSLPGAKWPRNFRSLKLSFSRVFAPRRLPKISVNSNKKIVNVITYTCLLIYFQKFSGN